jgi:hypothetical protein
MDVFFQNPDDPDIKQNMDVQMRQEDFIVEHSSDVIIAVTRLIPDYNSVLTYKDLFSNVYSKSKLQNTSLHRKIKLMTPLFYIKTQMLSKSKNAHP